VYKKHRKQTVSQALRCIVLRHAFQAVRSKAQEVQVLQNMRRIADELFLKVNGNRDTINKQIAIDSLKLRH